MFLLRWVLLQVLLRTVLQGTSCLALCVCVSVNIGSSGISITPRSSTIFVRTTLCYYSSSVLKGERKRWVSVEMFDTCSLSCWPSRCVSSHVFMSWSSLKVSSTITDLGGGGRGNGHIVQKLHLCFLVLSPHFSHDG